MIPYRDWVKITGFAFTPQTYRVVGPWGWENSTCRPDTDELLEFMAEHIGIKPHIGKVKKDESR